MEFFTEETDEVGQDHDVVEVDILIDASVEDVWAIVSEPGWWINDGPVGDHEVDVDEDGIYHVNDPEAGAWLVEKAEVDPMDLVAFRWYPLAGDELPEERATRVEVSLSEEDGRVAVHVEEAGLSAVSPDEREALVVWEQAAAMWEEALTQIKEHVEACRRKR